MIYIKILRFQLQHIPHQDYNLYKNLIFLNSACCFLSKNLVQYIYSIRSYIKCSSITKEVFMKRVLDFCKTKWVAILSVCVMLLLIGGETVSARGTGHPLSDGTFCERMYSPTMFCDHDRYRTGEIVNTHTYKVFGVAYTCKMERLICLHYYKCEGGHRFDYATADCCCVLHDSCGKTEEIYLCTAGYYPF